MGKKKEDLSIINDGLTIEGTISCKGRLLINGTLRGVLEGEIVEIGPNGAVFAETRADSITIGGTFEGELRTNELLVLSTGKLSGEALWKNKVGVEPGAVLNGKVNRITEPESTTLPPE